MNNEEIFTEDNISDFYDITGDEFGLNKARHLMEQGKLAIVPGFLNFSSVASKFGDAYLRDYTNLIQIYFSSFLSMEETVHHDASPGNLELLLHAIRVDVKKGVRQEVDLLTKGGNHTRLASASSISHEAFEGEQFGFEYMSENLWKFGRLINAEKDISDFLYTICCSSSAIIQHINDQKARNELGITDAENKIRETRKAVGEGEAKYEPNYFAIYESIEIALPNGFFTIDHPLPVCFTVKGEKAQGKYIDFNIRCEQKGKDLFTGVYNLRGASEHTIARVCKNIPERSILE